MMTLWLKRLAVAAVASLLPLSSFADGIAPAPGVTITDGTHTVPSAGKLTITGGVVGGTPANATLSVGGTGTPGGSSQQFQINNGSGGFGALPNPLPIANGGTGTASPGLTAGSNVTITGSWPNNTISSSGGGSSNFPPVSASAAGMAAQANGTNCTPGPGPAGGTCTDNSPDLQALLNLNGTACTSGWASCWTTSSALPGTGVYFAPVANQTGTYYYFNQALTWSRSGPIDCYGSGEFGGSNLVFAAGVSGVVFGQAPMALDGGDSQGSSVNGCNIQSASFGVLSGHLSADGATTISGISSWHYGPIQPTTYEAGDGLILLPSGGKYSEYPNWFDTQPGAYISACSPCQSGVGVTLANDPVVGQYTTWFTPGTIGSGYHYSFRLPVELRYTISTVGPGTLVSTFAFSQGATSFHVTNCFGAAAGMAVMDATTNKEVGIVSSCALGLGGATALNLTGASPVSSGGSNDTLQLYVDTPSTGSWTTSSTSIPVTSCSNIAAGQLVYDGVKPTQLSSLGTVQSCTGTTLTLTAAASASGSSGDPIWLEGSNSATVTAGPNCSTWQKPECQLAPGDFIWGSAIPFGVTIRTVTGTNSGTSGGQVVTFGNGWGAGYTPLNITGSTYAWKIPAGIDRANQTYSKRNTIFGFPFGLKGVCDSHQSPICTGINSIDEGNSYNDGMIGRVWGGNNVGASTSVANTYGGNFLADVADGDGEGSLYSGDNLNSEEGSAAYAPVLGCGGFSEWVGMYATAFGGFHCLNQFAGWTPPTVLNGSGGMWFGANATFFQDSYYIFQNQFENGPWTFNSPNNAMALTTTTSAPSGAKGLYFTPEYGFGVPTWVYPGVSVADSAGAIPSNDTVAAVNGSAITLASGLTSAMPVGDVITFGGGNGFTVPCYSVNPGVLNASQYNPTSQNYLTAFGSGSCGSGDWNLAFNGPLNAFSFGINNTQETIYASTAYAGYNPGGFNAGNVVFPRGVLLDNASTWGNTGGGLNTENLLDEGSSAPSQFGSATTATAAWVGGTPSVPLTSCTGMTGQMVDTTTGNSLGYTATFGCGATTGGIPNGGSSGDTITATQFVQASAAWTTSATTISLAGGGCQDISAGMVVTDVNTGQSVGTVSACSSSLTLTASASHAGSAYDTLKFVGTTTASANFAPASLTIPVTSCGGANRGYTVVDTTLSSPGTILGTVAGCSGTTLTLTKPALASSSGGTDGIVFTDHRQGDVRLNSTAKAGGTMAWANAGFSTGSNTFFPAGPIAVDTAGTTWALGDYVELSPQGSLTGCGTTYPAGTYGALSGSPASPEFCNGTSWVGLSGGGGGGVSGPGSTTVGHFATWNNTTGTTLADSTAGTGVLTALGLATDASGGVALVNGTPTSGDCLKWSTTGVQDAGAACAGSLTFPVTVAGTTTSGGIPYFSSTTQLSSSAALAANALVIGGGAGVAPSTTTTGSGVLTALGLATDASGGVALVNGTPTSGDCLKWSTTGVQDAGAACGSGGGGISGPGTTVSGDIMTWNNTTGTSAADSGIVASQVELGADHPGYISGNWYPVLNAYSATGTAQTSTSFVTCSTFPIHISVTIKNIGIHVSTLSSGGHIGFAIYTNGTNHRPGTLVDFAAVGSTGATGDVTMALNNTTDTLSPGMYWICSAEDNTTAIVEGLVANNTLAVAMGSSSIANVDGTIQNVAVTCTLSGATCGSGGSGWSAFSGGAFTWGTLGTGITWADMTSNTRLPYSVMQVN